MAEFIKCRPPGAEGATEDARKVAGLLLAALTETGLEAEPPATSPAEAELTKPELVEREIAESLVSDPLTAVSLAIRAMQDRLNHTLSPSAASLRRTGLAPHTPPEYLPVPLSWFSHIQRGKYGVHKTPRVYLEAILVLAYVVKGYRRMSGTNKGPFWVSNEWIERELQLTTGSVKAALRFLEDGRYIRRILIKGFTPWPVARHAGGGDFTAPQKSGGTYRYILPVIPRIREITEESPLQREGNPPRPYGKPRGRSESG